VRKLSAKWPPQRLPGDQKPNQFEKNFPLLVFLAVGCNEKEKNEIMLAKLKSD